VKRTPEHLRRVRELFDTLVDVPIADRDAALDRLAEGDAALRQDVEQMLAPMTHTAATYTPQLNAREHLAAADPGPLEGTRLGHYDIVRLIGVGGMGTVYEAVRADDQYRQRVAIKLVQRDIDSDVALARFLRERQILASLQHHNIGVLLDGGVTPDGRPYLVMEYIEGEPITAWCTARALGVRERVALFRQVCSAVAHAHQNLVVHRDIKPGNILVTADGTVKLLDFGIAKLVDADTGDDAMPLTRGGARAYTPEYASPEQIRGGALRTSSDVYSLGVVLFELLTGRRPHVVASRAAADMERAVLDEPVPRPSTVITEGAAHQRGERSAARLSRQLRGELDNIVLTALRPEAERRYSSVEAFGDDLQRHLAGEPIRAHHDWAGYRLRKFAQRNAGAVTASALVLIALVGGVIATTVQSRRARSEQLKEQQINGFLRTLLSSVKPVTGGRDVTASELLDAAARRLDVDRTTPADIRAELQTVIGQSYQSLGRYAEAERLDTAALALRQQLEGANSASAAAVLGTLAELYTARGDLDRADTMIHRALALQRARSSRPDSLLAALTMSLGSLAHNRGDLKAAEQFHREALAMRRRLFGDRSDQVAISLNDVAVTLGEQGKFADAEPLHREAVAILRTNHPQPTLELAAVINALAGVLDLEGKPLAADSAYREALALRKQLLGAEHPDYALTLTNYAGFLFDQQRYREAADDSRELLALRGKTLPESHPSIAYSLQTLGRSLDHEGDTTGARAALEESLALRRKYVGPTSWLAGNSEGVLGEHYTLVRQYAKAEEVLLHANDVLVHALGANHPRVATNVRRLVALYTAWNKPAKVAEYQAKLPPPAA
jgi:serine/threonine protein kinase/tetratricopeptide (TPR) repeat protein